MDEIMRSGKWKLRKVKTTELTKRKFTVNYLKK